MPAGSRMATARMYSPMGTLEGNVKVPLTELEAAGVWYPLPATDGFAELYCQFVPGSHVRMSTLAKVAVKTGFLVAGSNRLNSTGQL